MSENLEDCAETLEASGEYRVLRRFSCPGRYCEDEATDLLRGVFLDVETTGTDTRTEKIIELAMVPFEYSPDGRVFAVEEAFVGLQDPGRPLPPFITALTGITDEELKGKSIDAAAVASFLTGTSLVIAHNADFDRPFFEKTFPGLEPLPWACSQREVPWGRLGVRGRKLEYIAYRSGVFFDGHRAEVDCQVGVHVLATDWLGDGRTALGSLLESARRVDARLWALGSPFETKDLLKARGYRWDGGRRVWYRDLPEPELEAERIWLAEAVYGEELRRRGRVRLKVTLVSARERYRGTALEPKDDFWVEPVGLFSSR
ncbi:MAG TPA: 3'-5' exonuclease [Trueperaceae bacterium]